MFASPSLNPGTSGARAQRAVVNCGGKIGIIWLFLPPREGRQSALKKATLLKKASLGQPSAEPVSLTTLRGKDLRAAVSGAYRTNSCPGDSSNSC